MGGPATQPASASLRAHCQSHSAGRIHPQEHNASTSKTQAGRMRRSLRLRLRARVDRAYTSRPAMNTALLLVSLLSATPSPEEAARSLVADLAKSDFAAVSSRFDERMAKAVPTDKLGQVWTTVVTHLGAFARVEKTQVNASAGVAQVALECAFAKGKAVVSVTFDKEGRVSGLFIRPADAAPDWKPPPYANAGAFTEQEVTVGTAPKLPGHLVLPAGEGPFPVVILVHGSGPNDADETIGPNKVFKDLAQGLGSKGIATLRYEKRTRVAPAGVRTIQDEVLDDVAHAIALAKTTPKLDPHRVFVLGHSLGGYLIPWIAKDNPGLAGVVMLAAPARPLLELLVEQREALAKAHPESQGIVEAVAQAKAWRTRSEAKDLLPDEELFHAPGAYWLGLRPYRILEVARALELPMLVLQGERDLQVSYVRDFGPLKSALEKRPRVQLIGYPALNHLFIAGEGPPSLEEYARPSHVDAKVISDVAAWIAHTPAPAGH